MCKYEHRALVLGANSYSYGVAVDGTCCSPKRAIRALKETLLFELLNQRLNPGWLARK